MASDGVTCRSVTPVLPRRPIAGHERPGRGKGIKPMQRALSDRFLRSLVRPNSKDQEIWDPSLRGFGCRARKTGVVSFFVMRRPRGQRKLVRLTLGSYPTLGLAEARARAREALREL